MVLCLASVPGAGQAPLRPVVRADLAALDPSAAQGIHLAWGAGAGLLLGTHSTLLLDLTRQNLADEVGANSFWQTYVGASWEYAFGASRLYHRQGMVILRAGGLFRPSGYDTAPYLGIGAGLRYAVAPWLHFQARLEGDLDVPKGQTVQSCIAPGYCTPVHVGGHAEYDLGLYLGAEVHS